MTALGRILFLLLLLLPAAASAHVGSPDVYFEGAAGPYRLYVTVRPPEVIPGVADVQVRAESGDLSRLRIVPLPLTGPGASFAPTPDVAARLQEDPQTFTGHLWMMTTGAWQVRILCEGARGPGELAVPVPTLPQRTRGMQAALGALLGALLLLLCAGLVSIAGAAVREAQLSPGLLPDETGRRHARAVMAAAAVLLALGVLGGASWWRAEARSYAAHVVYRPLRLDATVADARLLLKMSDPDLGRRPLGDLLPDHDHLMHLFVLRMPGMDRVFHLHPTQTGPGTFTADLPALAAGRYQLYADIVHEGGVPETLVSTLVLSEAMPGRPLAGDDSAGAAPPLGSGAGATVAPLPSGGRMVWLRDEGHGDTVAAIRARTPRWFRFRIEDRPGHGAEDLELYMGMLGHAAFVKHDGRVFAHLHPSGSVPMAALALTGPAGGRMAHHHEGALPAEVSFPYGFPEAGDYRLFIQVKRKGGIETGAFDVHVTD